MLGNAELARIEASLEKLMTAAKERFKNTDLFDAIMVLARTGRCPWWSRAWTSNFNGYICTYESEWAQSYVRVEYEGKCLLFAEHYDFPDRLTIETFHDGPWVEELVTKATEIYSANRGSQLVAKILELKPLQEMDQ